MSRRPSRRFAEAAYKPPAMWEQIAANRRRSAVLITTMAAVLLSLGYLAGEAIAPGAGLIGLTAAFIIWLIQMGLYFGAAESVLLAGSGAHEIQKDDSPRLFNVVEEMVLASGLGYTPRIYLIDDPAPNAFAIGRKPGSSAVAVTTGLLHRLNRDELQGVIAHEIGHLKNQDVKFMTLAAVMLGSIVMLSEIFLRSLRFGGRSSRRSESRGGGGQAQLILLVIAIAFAILGPLFAQVLYFACSRKREFLADASAAQFTRYPEGLASALEKIAGASMPVTCANKTTAPLYIVNPLAATGQSLSLFSTHPAGSGRVACGALQAEVGPGDVYLIPPNQPFDEVNTGAGSWEYVVLLAHATPDAPLVAGLPAAPVVFRADFAFFDRFMQLLARLNRRAAGDELAALGLTLEILGEGQRQAEAQRTGRKPGGDSAFVARATAYLRERLRDPAPLATVARHCHMSPSTFSHRFKAEAGLTPMHWLARERMQVARRLLLEGRTAAETAAELGFANPFHFSRVFRKIEGVPPSQFQRLSRIPRGGGGTS